MKSLSLEFVSLQDDIYVVSDREIVDSDDIGQNIGEITEYIDKEGQNYEGTVSNVFKKGTNLYEINGIGEAIAVQNEKENM
jgi:hypothetical protein